MTTGGGERHQLMDAARVQAQLTVEALWLRYLALGGTGDEFDLDGYLEGVTGLRAPEQNVLAQALNEALDDCYRSYLLPMSTLGPVAGADDGVGSRPVVDGRQARCPEPGPAGDRRRP